MIKKICAHFIILFSLTCHVLAACGDLNYQDPLAKYSHNAQSYGQDRGDHDHQGVDLRTTGMTATQSGTVQTGTSATGGNYAIITSNDGNFRTVYLHAGSLNVANGSKITAGTSLGDWSKCTGRCEGSGGEGVCPPSNPCNYGQHVHYETQVKTSSGSWTSVDPQIVNQMIKEGKDPCDPNFGDEALKRTLQKHPGFIAGGFGARGGGGGTPPISSGTSCLKLDSPQHPVILG